MQTHRIPMKVYVWLTAAAILLSSLFTLAVGNPRTANALTGSDFQAGNIIDDGVFYDSSTIQTEAIQTFLEAKVPVCDTNGQQMYSSGVTRAEYGASRGYSTPFTCIKDYVEAVPSITNSGSNLCGGSISAGTKTAARIIYEVGQACGINPQVLIVLLQKEQALITDDWPWSIQYRSATGYGCPDTAPCDAEYYGFFNQVYQAAKAFRRYEANPASYNFRSNRNNFIGYHPNASCGGSNIFIENQATANLYIYTPYQPNQSALDNIYGSGDDCGAYGNRNFWRIFNDWFGSTQVSTPYAWSLESVDYFTDAARTEKITNGIVSISPEQKVYATLKARNVGSNTWSNTRVKLGTSRSRDRSSNYESDSWLSFKRLTRLEESTVQLGETGTFLFELQAGSKTGEGRESFNLVSEGIAWMHGADLTINPQVTQEAAPSATNNSLTAGDSLQPDQTNVLRSPDLHTTLILQNDGNLVLNNRFSPSWSSRTNGRAVSRFTMQHDGNFVAYDASNTPIWQTATGGNPGAYLTLLTDGNLVVNNTSHTPLWESDTATVADGLKYTIRTLGAGERMIKGQSLTTADRKYRLTMQHDGNFVLYRTNDNKALWAAGTKGSGDYVKLQYDGNLIVLDSTNKPLWHTRTNGRGPDRLTLQYDGNLVLYTAQNTSPWNTSALR